MLLNFARCIKKKLQTMFSADPLRPHTFVSDASNAATTNTSGTPLSVRRTLEHVPRSQATRHPPPSNYLLVNHHTSPVPRILSHNAVMSCFVLFFHWVTKTELRLWFQPCWLSVRLWNYGRLSLQQSMFWMHNNITLLSLYISIFDNEGRRGTVKKGCVQTEVACV